MSAEKQQLASDSLFALHSIPFCAASALPAEPADSGCGVQLIAGAARPGTKLHVKKDGEIIDTIKIDKKPIYIVRSLLCMAHDVYAGHASSDVWWPDDILIASPIIRTLAALDITSTTISGCITAPPITLPPILHAAPSEMLSTARPLTPIQHPLAIYQNPWHD